MNSELKIRLDRIVNDLAKTDGIDGSLIVDGNGEILSHHLLQDVDIELFGPMANVITGSSKRLTNFSNQGNIERILVESEKGKALFLHLGNVHFIVLMKNKANVGMIMISSKRAGDEIINLTKDLTPIQLEEQTTEEESIEETRNIEKVELEEDSKTFKEEPDDVSVLKEKVKTSAEEIEEPTEYIQPVEETKPETVADNTPQVKEEIEEIVTSPEETATPETAQDTKSTVETTVNTSSTEIKESVVKETSEKIRESSIKEITGKSEEPTVEIIEPLTEISKSAETAANSEISSQEAVEKISDSSEVAGEEILNPSEDSEGQLAEKTGTIPVIKPPISFPKLKKVTEIPKDQEERVDLLLKIYESIFLAMSIGASKIMGVAPARGLTRKFLPVEDCKTLLDGVDVKNNSAIDFVKIKENADKIPLEDREKIFKESFGKIITIITENYGKVMGYAAFRAMIRPEFKIINESYGHLLDELEIKEQLHHELQDFFK